MVKFAMTFCAIFYGLEKVMSCTRPQHDRRETVAPKALKLQHQRRRGLTGMEYEGGVTELLHQPLRKARLIYVLVFKTKSPMNLKFVHCSTLRQLAELMINLLSLSA